MQRRNFIRSAFGILIAAPMVVKAENIMRVKPIKPRIRSVRFDAADWMYPSKMVPEKRSVSFCVKPEKSALYLLSHYDEQKKVFVEEFFDLGQLAPHDVLTIIRNEGSPPVAKIHSISGTTRTVVRDDFVQGHSWS